MNLLTAALLLLGVVGVTIAALYMLRRRAPAGGFYANVDRAGSIFGVVGTAFAVLLAFVIFRCVRELRQREVTGSTRG